MSPETCERIGAAYEAMREMRVQYELWGKALDDAFAVVSAVHDEALAQSGWTFLRSVR